MTSTVPEPGRDVHVEIDGVSFHWDRARDLFLINGMPAAGLLVESTLANLMWGMERMVGRERFDLAVQAAGRQSIEGEWEAFISRMPSPRIGIEMMGQVTALGGLGRIEILEWDEANKRARFKVSASWEPLVQRALGVTWGSSFMAGKLAGYCTRAFGTYCWSQQLAFETKGAPHDEFLVHPSDLRLEQRLEDLLFEGKATAADLAAALERLRVEVEERRQAEARMALEVEERTAAEERLLLEAAGRERVEAELREQLTLVEQQAADIQAMSTPILQVWSGVLAVPVVGRLDSARAARMMETLLAAIVERRARAAILDLTGAEGVDTAALDHLLALARAITLLGARCLISGFSPAVAEVAVGLGVELGGLSTFATLEAALQHAIAWMSKRTGKK